MSHPKYENPKTLGKPLGSYSHVAMSGSIMLVAGQVGITRDGDVPPEVFAQVKLTFDNISLALESQGLTLRNVLKFTTYLTHEDYIPEFFRTRDELFPGLFPGGEYPANTLLVISRLVRPEFLVEIEAIASS